MTQVIGHQLMGSGSEKVMVLHGWMGDHSVFNGLFDVLDLDTFTYTFVDYRGYGLSMDLEGAFTMAEIVQDVLHLANHLKWDRFHAIGHSMGGMAIQLLNSLAEGRVQSMVGITPVPATGFPMEGDMLALFDGAANNPENRGIICHVTTGEKHTQAWIAHMVKESLRTTSQKAFGAYFKAWSMTNFKDQLAHLDTPFKVIVGKNDPAVTQEVMQGTILQWYSQTEISIMEQAGHYPMLEVPLTTVNECETFIKKHLFSSVTN